MKIDEIKFLLKPKKSEKNQKYLEYKNALKSTSPSTWLKTIFMVLFFVTIIPAAFAQQENTVTCTKLTEDWSHKWCTRNAKLMNEIHSLPNPPSEKWTSNSGTVEKEAIFFLFNDTFFVDNLMKKYPREETDSEIMKLAHAVRIFSLFDYVKYNYTHVGKYSKEVFNTSYVAKYKTGVCRQQTLFAVSILRALGIPSRADILKPMDGDVYHEEPAIWSGNREVWNRDGFELIDKRYEDGWSFTTVDYKI